jgi:hypothetical protein
MRPRHSRAADSSRARWESSFQTTGSHDWRASRVRDAVTATSQFAAANVFKIVIGAARFVAGDAADATVGGLAFEAEIGTVDFSDDVPPRERSYTGAVMEPIDGVEDRIPAAQAAIGDLGLQCGTVMAGPWMASWRFVLCKPRSTNRSPTGQQDPTEVACWSAVGTLIVLVMRALYASDALCRSDPDHAGTTSRS